MSEELRFKSVGGMKDRDANVVMEDDLEARGFGRERKTRVTVEIESPAGRRRKVSFVERPLKPRRDCPSYAELWEIFKSAGLPVAPTLRVTDRNTVILGDLATGGKEFFGKAMGMRMLRLCYAKEEGILEHAKLMPVFLRTLDRDGDKIRRRLQEIAMIATDHNIRISTDDPFDLRLSPDGSWEVYMLDIVGGKVEERHDLPGEKAAIEDHNRSMVERFMGDLQGIKETYEAYLLAKSGVKK